MHVMHYKYRSDDRPILFNRNVQLHAIISCNNITTKMLQCEANSCQHNDFNISYQVAESYATKYIHWKVLGCQPLVYLGAMVLEVRYRDGPTLDWDFHQLCSLSTTADWRTQRVMDGFPDHYQRNYALYYWHDTKYKHGCCSENVISQNAYNYLKSKEISNKLTQSLLNNNLTN